MKGTGDSRHPGPEERKLMRYGTIIHISLIALLISCLSACSPYHASVSKNLKIDAAFYPERKIPLRAGLYVPAEFKNERLFFKGHSVGVNVSLGEGMTVGAAETLKLVFEEIVILDETETNFSKRNIDVIVTPTMEKKGIDWLGGSRIQCFLRVKWTVIDKNGNMVYVNSCDGEDQIKVRYMKDAEDFSACMTSAAEKQYGAFSKLIVSTVWWNSMR
ncbi:MAG: hypothetical protein M1377_08560 [Deltaproteobacteria bacterium]|nr:hypothetical protein [Deltaproteobacteria bacterium]